MDTWTGPLLLIVCLTGAGVVGFVVRKLTDGEPEDHLEILITALAGAGLLIWPVAQSISMQSPKEIEEIVAPFLDLDLERYRLVDTESGEQHDIAIDPKSFAITITKTAVVESVPGTSDVAPQGPQADGESGAE